MIKIDNLFESSHQSQLNYSLKILGLERDGKFLLAQTSKNAYEYSGTRICIYHKKNKTFDIAYTLQEKVNVVQASINNCNNILVFVCKNKISSTINEEIFAQCPKKSNTKHCYRIHIINIRKKSVVSALNCTSEKQIMAQFLYSKKPNNTYGLLVLTHFQSITLYELSFNTEMNITVKLSEIIINSFCWAQWDSLHQCLFYIYHKNPLKTEDKNSDILIPTLSALQFHDDMPHETVLTIPLNIPDTKHFNNSKNIVGVYDDVPIPLRIQDCSLNILVLMQSTGVVYICHSYFFQSTDKSKYSDSDLSTSNGKNNNVYYAYSITVLHHGSIIHCSASEFNWRQVYEAKPLFCMFEDQHLMVFSSDLFTHVLDVGVDHEPCCHFFISNQNIEKSLINLVPLPGTTSEILNLTTLEILKICIPKKELFNSFIDDHFSIYNKLSILHYILVHLNDTEIINEIVMLLAKKLTDVNIVKFLKEILVGGCYASVTYHLSNDKDSSNLLRLLPLTSNHMGNLFNEKVNSCTFTLEQEMLCNPSVMLLTPRQRLIPFRSDIWTKLWEHLPNHILNHPETSRFNNSTVIEKLAVSLICYQPEALSRCCTPRSPGVSHMVSTGMLADIANVSRPHKSNIDALPFNEIESSAASRQEHIISVNLREISLHLVKLSKSPMQIHAVAMRYVSSQLELSRILCLFLTKAAKINTERTERGFLLIDSLHKNQRRLLFALLQRYYTAVDLLAFPLPQGFSSFFSYLGYRVFPIPKFIDFARANIFQVNIDVMKAIMIDLPDTEKHTKNKLNLLLQLPKSRVKRILNQWSHPASLMIRAREHSLNILSGISGIPSRNIGLPKGIRHGAGLSALTSNEQLSPLDTFLDLLTAKANLSDIDFNLLIEATLSSCENDFLKES